MDAIIDQGRHDFIEPELHFRESLRERGTGTEGVVTSENAFGVLKALVIVVVIEAEFLTAKGWGAAESAIFFEMAAEGNGHGCLQSCQPSALSRQPTVQIVQAAGIPAANNNCVL
ncbi:MAG: hypothetical protein WAN69_18540 [Candidatus Korobacteraceae bacterium]